MSGQTASLVRAAWYRETGPASSVLEVGDLPDGMIGTPGPGDVALRIHASGINPADVKRRAGWGGLSMTHELIVPHADGAGVIEAVGESVTGFEPGDRVWMRNAQGGYGEAGRAYGTAAERICLPAEQVFKLPSSLDFAAGACLGIPALTAYDAVFADGSVGGKTVLVTGAAGAVGHFAAQFALSAGARVIATVSDAEKAAHVQSCGVDDIIMRHDEDVVARVLDLTDGRGVDRVVEVDFGANLEATRRLLKPHSVVAAYSSTAVPEPVLPYYDFAFCGATLRFVQGFLLTPDVLSNATTFIDGLAETGKLQVAIAARFPLERIAEAHEMVEGGTAIGNVVIEVP
ncbi:NADPH:quinone reductase [Hoeflea prorocentri]|uniref:NADPH:quinone reductase n=1 Tax=Hoeflea prorocentri TaxID=1922333 RepID=A0A9X3ZJA0_9HYPH|nr:NADPH:quinone reductase [Hoeflea prorocentri]MCY6382590.1 NADPH:quinone reductase [Hoeflea prorocentri]MDA5400390.1 NADPH:quinone reductase [Hoeflea prorocentri]